jgi:hypothetical protein
MEEAMTSVRKSFRPRSLEWVTLLVVAALSPLLGQNATDTPVTVLSPACDYSTYLGGSAGDNVRGVFVGPDRSVYLTGATTSTDFTTKNPLQSTNKGGFSDAFVSKISPDGSLAFSTYLGGSAGDIGFDVAVDDSGYVYVSGGTNSTDFPTTTNAFQKSFAGGSNDIFVCKISPDGKTLVYSTFLGGSSSEGYDTGGYKLAVDRSGYAYVTTGTSSINFPTTPGSFQPSYGGGTRDAVVAKLNRDGSSLVYSTFLGADSYDYGEDIAVDDSGYAYVAGSTQYKFPLTPGAFQTVYGGGIGDAFVTKLNRDGSSLVFSTFYGGNSNDEGHGIAVDREGYVCFTGYTASTNLPLKNPLDSAYQYFLDAYVAKLSRDGSKLVFSTYLGGSADFDQGGDIGEAVALDGYGNIYVTGRTGSLDFQILSPIQAGYGGARDAFITVLNPSGTAYLYSSYLGGSGIDQGLSIAVAPAGIAYVGGVTASSNFPLVRPVQTTFGGMEDGYLSRIVTNPTPVEERYAELDEFRLFQNYPNPFNPSTTIRYELPRREFVILKIFDLLGREVATLVNEQKQPGSYDVRWSGVGVPSGAYFYRLQAGEYVEIRAMLMVR